MPNKHKKPFCLKEMFDNSLHFRYETKEADIDTFLDVIGDYNEFDAFQVKEMLAMMDKILPYYTSGQRRYKTSIGREGSPVIYLTIYATGNDNKTLVEQLKLAEPVLKKIAHETGKADEFGMEYTNYEHNFTKIEIRMWWD